MAKQPLRTAATSKTTWNFPWNKRQFILLGAGVAVIIAGFLLLATGMGGNWDSPLAVAVAPVVLVIGFCVVVPYAILSSGPPSGE